MINAEFYKEKLLEFAEDNKEIALNNNGDIVHCGNDINCNQCKWNYPKTSTCECEKIKWLLAEHKEYPRLTKYEFETLEKMRDAEYSWIARNNQDYINIFLYKPTKKSDYWVSNHKALVSDIYDMDFDFIQWTDEEPWNIQELLENCEVVKEK